MQLLELIQILDAIDRKKTFEAAACELNKVRSALTYTIKKYEDRLGIEIYDRSHHRAQLTPAGKVLLNEGRHLMRSNERLMMRAIEVANGWESRLSIVYDELLQIEPLMALANTFMHHCPHVDLVLGAERLNGCLDALINGRGEIAVGLSGQLPASKEFSFIEIGEIDFIFAVSPNHLASTLKEPLSQECLSEYIAIVATDTAQNLASRTTGLFSNQTVFSVTSMALKKKAQIDGLGVGFLPTHLIKRELYTGALITKEVVQKKPTGKYYLAWRNDSMGKAKKWLLNQLKEKTFYQQLFKPEG